MKIIFAFVLTLMLMSKMVVHAQNDKTVTINSDLIPLENLKINKFKHCVTRFVFQKK